MELDLTEPNKFQNDDMKVVLYFDKNYQESIFLRLDLACLWSDSILLDNTFQVNITIFNFEVTAKNVLNLYINDTVY